MTGCKLNLRAKMNNCMMIALFFCSNLPVSLATQVPLYTAEKEGDFLSWRNLPRHPYDDNGKYQDQNSSVHVCGKPKTMWFIYGPAIRLTDTDETVPKQVNITMVLDLDYRKKNPEIGLKTFQSESNAQPLDYGGVKQKYTLSDAKTTIMYQLKRTNEYLFIGVLVPQLAIPDPGLKDSECLTISKVFVSYKRCKATKKNMATYPSGVAPSDDEPYTKIKGVCNSNAEPVNKEKGVELYCDKNGTPFQIYGCQCKAGYTLGDSSSCTVCSDGLYKGDAGDGQCQKCGANSESSRDGQKCLCKLGFSRDLSDEKSSFSECKTFIEKTYNIGSIIAIVILALLLVIVLGVGYALRRRREPEQPQQPQIVNVINNHQVGEAVHPENEARPLLNQHLQQAYGANLANHVAEENPPAVVNNGPPQGPQENEMHDQV
eukprot:Seg1622.11 transcript_id=Seg1622.11/GoldUCD/mRNA.D3Y31 product="Ephrin type-B receptor 1-B" protein_id=Seg1622.11/GoldUCD/D3Y31